MAATSNSTTVDLSRLPAPVIVEQKTFETIVAEMVAQVQALLPNFDATVDSDPAVKVLQTAAYRELLIRQAFQDGGKQLMVAFATDARLDHLGALVGVARLVVTPGDAATGAEAIYEDDDTYRQRIVLAPEGFSVAGPELAYVKHAKDASADVLDASATSPAPGEVLVSVLSATGNGTAPAALLASVAEIVTDPAIRPLGDLVTVASATIIGFAITASLITFDGPDINLVLAAARTRLDAYLAFNRKLGRTITTSGITAALTVEGVHKVNLPAPIADIDCDLTEAANCTGIAITHGGYAS
ncbi:baseplate assembly protein [Sphingomonas sp. CFBP9019]|uniref:baseplate assembly protein n=1 Tax=Sphingomonas sp. CFBP9019 TaxID=3096532 RepID=UPI002A6AD232|nr:baseplate J/gp47 family protein [Sphingomonas sp. CFBP9019]MDY1008778.1 baseplate J/gp47 family protein [Sphingomonas sp. CFBP9019]